MYATSTKCMGLALEQKNQTTLAFIGGGLVITLGGAWQAYLHFSEKPSEAPKVTASEGGIAAGGNISATSAPGGTAVVAAGNVTIGITPEQFATELKRREQEIRHELAQASAADKEKIALLEKQLADTQAKLENPQAALEDYKNKLAQARQALDDLQGEFSAEQLEQARQGLTKGDVSKAEMLFRQVLLVSESKEKTAESAYQLGQLATGRIDYRSAYQYHKQAAELQPDNPLYLNAAGEIAYTVGRYSEAEPLLQRALAIREKALGPEHPDVAASLNNLAALYDAQGQYAEAEPLYQRALAIWEKALGPEHPDVDTGLENYAALLQKLGRSDEAKRMEARAEAIRDKH